MKKKITILFSLIMAFSVLFGASKLVKVDVSADVISPEYTEKTTKKKEARTGYEHDDYATTQVGRYVVYTVVDNKGGEVGTGVAGGKKEYPKSDYLGSVEEWTRRTIKVVKEGWQNQPGQDGSSSSKGEKKDGVDDPDSPNYTGNRNVKKDGSKTSPVTAASKSSALVAVIALTVCTGSVAIVKKAKKDEE